LKSLLLDIMRVIGPGPPNYDAGIAMETTMSQQQ
jgi:hypothetical protein